MRPHDLARYVKTESRSSRLVCDRRGAARKLLEDEVDILGGEPGSIIGHLDAHLLAIPMSAQLDGGAGRRVLGGILRADYAIPG